MRQCFVSTPGFVSVVRKVLGHCSHHEILSLSMVNKKWNFDAKTLLKKWKQGRWLISEAWTHEKNCGTLQKRWGKCSLFHFPDSASLSGQPVFRKNRATKFAVFSFKICKNRSLKKYAVFEPMCILPSKLRFIRLLQRKEI